MKYPKHTKVDITQAGKHFYIRPAGQLGTCGFYPFAWDAMLATSKAQARAICKINNLVIISEGF